jgi:hypothetical protein
MAKSSHEGNRESVNVHINVPRRAGKARGKLGNFAPYARTATCAHWESSPAARRMSRSCISLEAPQSTLVHPADQITAPVCQATRAALQDIGPKRQPTGSRRKIADCERKITISTCQHTQSTRDHNAPGARTDGRDMWPGGLESGAGGSLHGPEGREQRAGRALHGPGRLEWGPDALEDGPGGLEQQPHRWVPAALMAGRGRGDTHGMCGELMHEPCISTSPAAAMTDLPISAAQPASTHSRNRDNSP